MSPARLQLLQAYSINELKKEAWKVFSKWIRERDNNQCFTCTAKGPERQIHAGHFVPRSHSATFLDPINVHAQCWVCNNLKHGNAGEYAYRLIEKYGKEGVNPYGECQCSYEVSTEVIEERKKLEKWIIAAITEARGADRQLLKEKIEGMKEYAFKLSEEDAKKLGFRIGVFYFKGDVLNLIENKQ